MTEPRQNKGSLQTNEQIVEELYLRLKLTLGALSRHIEANGKIDVREDETLALGACALAEAHAAGFIDENDRFDERYALIAVDDDRLSYSDSLLDDEIIDDACKLFDRIDEDNRTYVSGETTDWDQGMVAVAVFRTMVRSMRERTYIVRHEGESRTALELVQGVSLQDAAQVHAFHTFHDMKGEWMGGRICVMAANGQDLRDPATATALDMIGVTFDTDIDFPEDEDPVPTAKRL